MKTIKQSVINTFDRVGIPNDLPNEVKNHTVANWLTGEEVEVTWLIAQCIDWVYKTQMAFESGSSRVNISDFDRVRYFILEQDPEAYRTCID